MYIVSTYSVGSKDVETRSVSLIIGSTLCEFVMVVGNVPGATTADYKSTICDKGAAIMQPEYPKVGGLGG